MKITINKDGTEVTLSNEDLAKGRVSIKIGSQVEIVSLRELMSAVIGLDSLENRPVIED